MKLDTKQYNRGDGSIQNYLRMLRPILDEKELIGKRIKVSELVAICRNHRSRLPIHIRRSLELADELDLLGGGHTFHFDDLEISVYLEFDRITRRRSPEIEFQLAVSLEQLYLNDLEAQQLALEKEQLL